MIPADIITDIYGNLKVALKRASTSVTAIIIAAIGYWTSMDTASQQALIASHPILVPYAPYFGAAAWVAAILWSQKAPLNELEKQGKVIVSRSLGDAPQTNAPTPASTDVDTKPPITPAP